MRETQTNSFKMKQKLAQIIVALMVFGLTSCRSIDIFNENNEIPIAKAYHTFVIINKEVGMRGFSNQFLDEVVQIQLQETLENAGMRYDAKQPDLVIRYNSNEDTRQREVVNNPNPYPFWGYRVYNPWAYPYNTNRVSTSNYELLQVIVDFIDPVQDKFLMTLTGVTEKTLDSVLKTYLNQYNYSQN